MDFAVVGPLIVLALVDSTSFGTLLIPVWLLMAPGRVRAGRVVVFLATVTLMYFGIGVALLFGASALVGVFDGVASHDVFLIGQLLLGIALVVISHFMDNERARERAKERAENGTGRVARWRRQAMGTEEASSTTMVTVMALAVAAVALEVATMLPYLAGIGIIASSGPGGVQNVALVAGYCVVMILPALVLTIARVFAGNALDGPLSALDRWLTKNAQSTLAWVIAIIGVIMVIRALGGLDLASVSFPWN